MMLLFIFLHELFCNCCDWYIFLEFYILLFFLLMSTVTMPNKFLNHSYFLGLNNTTKFSKSNTSAEKSNYTVFSMLASVC